ncbi:MAG: manganese efflux pump [Syntrophomonadaceae bacterium]|nr:manganese efflux pump [Syntrophomonadaceae bacterium]
MNSMIEVFAVAVALGLDAFSVAMGLGLSGVSRYYRTRFIGTVALLHVAMPLLGLYLGLAAGTFMGKWAAIAGAVVLAYIGFQMIREGLREFQTAVRISEAREKLLLKEPETTLGGWASILVLGFSVSIDALAVGFGLGTARVPILYTVVTTGIVAGVMTGAGWMGGKYFSDLVGKRAQAAGGILLILMAIKMLM